MRDVLLALARVHIAHLAAGERIVGGDMMEVLADEVPPDGGRPPARRGERYAARR